MGHRGILHIIIVNLIIFFALISIHEMGHSVGGILSGCKYQRAVLLDSNLVGPYTEMYCSNINYMLTFFSSLLITTSFSFLFLLLKSPTRNLFPVSLGLSIIFSSLDISIAANMASLVYPIVSLGFIVTALGEYFVASSVINDRFPLDFLELEKEIS
jgi:hypothetical protein